MKVKGALGINQVIGITTKKMTSQVIEITIGEAIMIMVKIKGEDDFLSIQF